jgi:selenide,water dikinase
VGILTTAEKKGLLKDAHKSLASNQIMQLNVTGELLGKIEGVHAMTDVTGFGLLGHLIEMAEGSGLSSELYIGKIPVIINSMEYYVENNCIPGGTNRNWDSYGQKVGSISEYEKSILADPQTSGGLLIAVAPESVTQVKELLIQEGLEKFINPVGVLVSRKEKSIYINP